METGEERAIARVIPFRERHNLQNAEFCQERIYPLLTKATLDTACLTRSFDIQTIGDLVSKETA